MNAIQVLLTNSIDYAGLFPPAGLELRSAAENYARYRAGESAWALGRFVLPAGRLSELEEVAGHHFPRSHRARPWKIAVLGGQQLAGEMELVAAFNRRHSVASAGAAVVEAIEVKASSVSGVEECMRLISGQLQSFIEIPIERDPSELVGTIARLGGRAKVRTGGVTPEAFPTAGELLRFLRTCVHERLAFKATAGLHHPLRARYPLTYEPASPSGPMFGFLNLFLAAAFLHNGMNEPEAGHLLEETSPGAFHFGIDHISWRQHRLELPALRDARRDVILSFGSCSFSEPIEELQALHLLESSVPQA